MINAAIGHIAGQLNQYLKRSFDIDEDIVVAANLVGLDGAIPPHVNDKVVISLVNVRKDTLSRQLTDMPVGGARQVVNVPPLHLSLHLVLACNFAATRYAEALEHLSRTIAFFQRHVIFDHATTPGLDRRIERLTLELENLEFKELASLWSVLGGKYLPSVLYRMRLTVIDSDDVVEQTPMLSEPHSEVAGDS